MVEFLTSALDAFSIASFNAVAVFTLVTSGNCFDVDVKILFEPNGGIFDVRPTHGSASPNVKTPTMSVIQDSHWTRHVLY